MARAADLEKTDYLSVSRYSSYVTGELAIGNEERNLNTKPDFLLNTAWHCAARIKLLGNTNLFCPAYSTASWDVVGAISDNSVSFGMLDDYPRQISLRASAKDNTISQEDIERVSDNFENAFELRDSETSGRFGLAFNAMYSWNQTTDTRMALATLWVALEALFGKREDRLIRDSLSRRICDWLPDYSKERVKELYEHRCDAVHGRWLEDESLDPALMDTHDLLRRSLVKCIEEKSKTLPDWD